MAALKKAILRVLSGSLLITAAAMVVSVAFIHAGRSYELGNGSKVTVEDGSAISEFGTATVTIGLMLGIVGERIVAVGLSVGTFSGNGVWLFPLMQEVKTKISNAKVNFFILASIVTKDYNLFVFGK